jgi:hypothetical protein
MNTTVSKFCECSDYCLNAKCVSSDSGMKVRRCWCPECKERRAEIKAAAGRVTVVQWQRTDSGDYVTFTHPHALPVIAHHDGVRWLYDVVKRGTMTNRCYTLADAKRAALAAKVA